jgi:DNA mismatch repair protein MutS
MAELYTRIQNARVEVEEWGDRIVFLHKIGPGETDKSYGIEVARLAGLPSDVVTRAKSLLPTWEGQKSGPSIAQLPADPPAKIQLTLFESGTQRVAAALLQLDLDSLSPREALDKLFEIKTLLSSPPSVKTRKIS